MQTTHKFNVQRLESVATRSDKVKAAVDAGISDAGRTVDPTLRIQIQLKLLLDELNDWIPTFVIVHLVAESGRVNTGQVQLHPRLANRDPRLLHLQR